MDNSTTCFWDYMHSPVGTIKISANHKGITEISLSQEARDGLVCENDLTRQAKSELEQYFRGERHQFNVPLSLEGTEFQLKVWQGLMSIAYGQVLSYKQLAELIGKDRQSARAVGGANNKNPVMIMIPCHRICGQNGQLVGYAGGLDVKEWLLNWEENNLTKAPVQAL